MGDKIARLILFGSALSGETSEESDIDLLVVAIDELKEVEETGAEIAFDILLEMGEGIEPLVYCLDQLRYPESHFVYRNARIGREFRGWTSFPHPIEG